MTVSAGFRDRGGGIRLCGSLSDEYAGWTTELSQIWRADDEQTDSGQVSVSKIDEIQV